MYKILLTSSSFKETPGKHHELLKNQEFDVTYKKGPLKEKEILKIICDYDALICGDDELTSLVIKRGAEGKLKYISKYGVGLDKIDIKTARELNIQVENCANINQISVAEHVFALLLSYTRNIVESINNTKKGKWNRITGQQIYNKTIGIIGYGNIGKEVALRAKCFGLKVILYDKNTDTYKGALNIYNISNTIEELIENSDILSIHLPLNDNTYKIINKKIIKNYMKNNAIIINTSRGKIIDTDALLWGLDNGKIKAYLTDVLENEPIKKSDLLRKHNNVYITPHIGSRTYESVEKQAIHSINNLITMINKDN